MSPLREYVYGRHYKTLRKAYSAHEAMNARLTLAEALRSFLEHVAKLRGTDPFFEISDLEDEGGTVKLFNDFVRRELRLHA